MQEQVREFLTDVWGYPAFEEQVRSLLPLFRAARKKFMTAQQTSEYLTSILGQQLTDQQLRDFMELPLLPQPKILHFPSLVPGQPDNPMVEKEIGPEGGSIELENVARFELPAGALNQPTLIKISQVLQVESIKERNLTDVAHSIVPEGEALPGYDFITPVVRLEPFRLRLNAPALLYLPTDAARLGVNDPVFIQHIASMTAKNDSWQFGPFLEDLGSPDTPVKASLQEPIKVRELVYVAKQIPVWIKPDQESDIIYDEVDIDSESGEV